MEKWADYCVKRVHYDSDQSKIIECEVIEDLGDKFGSTIKQSKTTIVTNLKKGNLYLTIYLTSESKYKKGDNVITYKVDGEDFIRTDGNKIKKDNLGELPEY